MAGEPTGRPSRVMVKTPAASRQAVKEQPNASARPCLDAEKPPAGSAAAAITLLRIGMVTGGLMPPPTRVFAKKSGGYRPAWLPARAVSPLASDERTGLSPGMVAEATVILPCSRSKA